MEKIGLNNEMFFSVMSGSKSAVTSVVFTMNEKMDADKLREALCLVIKRFHYFRLKPFVDSDGKLVLKENNRQPDVYFDNGDVAALGTDETNGYLFRVLYKDKQIRVSAFHGLGDGRSISAFGLSVVRQYIILRGDNIDTGDVIVTPEDPVDPTETDDFYERCKEFIKGCPDPSEVFMPDKKYVIPGEREFYDSDSSRYFEISWRTSELKTACKKAGGTALTIMASALTEAIYRLYGKPEATITFNVPVDLRGIIGSRSQANFTLNIMLPYTGDADTSFEDKVRLFKSEMDVRLKPENLLRDIEGAENFLKDMTNIPLNDRQALEDFHNNLKIVTKDNATLLLTNIGVIRFPEALDRYIEDFEVVAVTLEYSPIFIMFTKGELGKIVVGQNYNDDSLLKSVCEILKEQGVNASVRDRGTIKGDRVFPYLFERA